MSSLENQKSKFYIFLDIDGVLTNYDWIFYAFETLEFRDVYDQYDERNVAALDYMIRRLSEEYEVVLVITSTLRKDLKGIDAQLKEKGLTYNGILYATRHLGDRGYEIKDFRYKNGVHDFIIIDDDTQDIIPYFDKSRIIETSYTTGGLNFQLVRKFLETINPDWIKPRF